MEPKKAKRQFPLARGLVVEIAIFMCDRVKIAINLAAVCRLFRAELLQNNRFWYFVYSAYKQTPADESTYFKLPQPRPDFYPLSIDESKAQELK